MQFNTDKSLIDFLQCIDKCKGDVYFKTKEGDVLNLKSQFSKLLFLTVVSADKDTILLNAYIECSDLEDQTQLAAYFLTNRSGL